MGKKFIITVITGLIGLGFIFTCVYAYPRIKAFFTNPSAIIAQQVPLKNDGSNNVSGSDNTVANSGSNSSSSSNSYYATSSQVAEQSSKAAQQNSAQMASMGDISSVPKATIQRVKDGYEKMAKSKEFTIMSESQIVDAVHNTGQNKKLTIAQIEHILQLNDGLFGDHAINYLKRPDVQAELIVKTLKKTNLLSKYQTLVAKQKHDAVTPIETGQYLQAHKHFVSNTDSTVMYNVYNKLAVTEGLAGLGFSKNLTTGYVYAEVPYPF